jgi:NitT/TauT family transport system substrate-binding protein
MRRLLLALFCALLFVPGVPAHALEKMLIGHTAGTDLLPAFLAKEQGFFEKHGIDATFQMATTGGTMITAVASDSIQASNATIAAMLFAVDQGIQMQVIGPIGASQKGYHLAGLLVRNDLDAKTAKDLEGHTVALPGLNAFLHILLVRWLKEEGADPSKVRFVEITFPQMTDALKSGRIDAATLIDPFLPRALKSGAAKLLSYFTDSLPDGTIPTAWVATKAYVDAHPDVIRGFQAALAEGRAYARAHPEAADPVLAKYLRMSPEVVKQAAKAPLLDEVKVDQIKFWVDLMRDQKLITRDIDPASLIAKP